MIDKYRLKLFVTGQTPRSEQAIAAARELCEAQLAGRYELEIIDVLDRPEVADADKVLATPTLIKAEPPPARRIIGELSRGDEVLFRLGLGPRPGAGRREGSP
jgi:circadian clock protein KaiB